MKVGLLGVGYWGSNHVRALQQMKQEGRIEGVVLADVDRARAEQAAKQAGCDAAASPEALLRDPSVGAVDIVTPTPTHFDLARKALEQGKHVLVEKPMTRTLEESEALVKLAEREGLVLMPGHLFRYHPGMEAAQQALRRGDLGEVRYLTASRQAFREPRPDMGVIHALAVHELDLFCWLLGRDYPDTLQCTLGGWLLPGIEEVAWIQMGFGQVKANATESWVSPWAGKERHFACFGTRGAAFVDFQDLRQFKVYDYTFEAQGRGYALHNEGVRTLPVTYTEPLMAELQDFVRCAQEGDTPRADMRCGLRGVAMVEACFRSAKEGRAVSLGR